MSPLGIEVDGLGGVEPPPRRDIFTEPSPQYQNRQAGWSSLYGFQMSGRYGRMGDIICLQ